GTPASACLRIETIWVSVNRDFFMEPPGCKDARKFYFQGVYGSGKLTEVPLPPPDVQKEIVAEIENYQREIERSRRAIAEDERKVREAVARVWGEK
ncbi:MAG TPA: hypothetical protein VFL96_10685, partial [Acidobacteriaceae bacterium]|nr:hypothetical protein [Acidobacteriaceae bacterium]